MARLIEKAMSNRKIHPPRLADRFLKWFCSDEVLETLQGDLYELYYKGRERHGKLWADYYFITGVIGACRPFAFRKIKHRSNSNIFIMYNNYLKIAWRNLVRHKAYSVLNIAGLAVGMACSILILLWVQLELSYDKFNANSSDIYRIVVDAGNGFKAATNPAGMPEGLAAEIPEVKSFVRLFYSGESLMEVGDTKFEEKRLYLADSNFLEVFTYPLIEGDRKTALAEPNNILVTQSMAKKYFGNEPPLGKILRVCNSENLVVSGVLADVASNSHLQFDFIVPMSNIARTNNDLKSKTWDNFEFYSYLQFQRGAIKNEADHLRLEKEVNRIYAERITSMVLDFHLQPLADIHLKSDYQIDIAERGNIQYVNSMFVIAIFILVVACINFMNLATARSARRAKEVGIRKVVGAKKAQLVWQFLTEAVLISLISLVFAVGLVYAFLPVFNNLADKQLSFYFLDGKFLGSLVALAFLTGLLSGSYPSLFLSSFKPIRVLYGRDRQGKGGHVFRNSLVVVQLVISVLLIVGAGVTRSQLSFLRMKNLGFDQSNLLYMPFKGEIWKKQEVLRDELSQAQATSDYTFISHLPANLTTGTVEIGWEGKDPDVQYVVPNIRVDENFFEVFKVEVIKGRAFSRDFPTDKSNYIINERMAEITGYDPENIVGKPLSYFDNPGVILGVVKNFNFKPLQYAIEPMVLQYSEYGQLAVIRTPMEGTDAVIKRLQAINEELNPAFPLSYNFVGKDLENQYKGEQQMGYIFNLFAVLAIMISCLGLYGLSAFVAEQATKQIGIRKVLGANLPSLVSLLSKDFLKLVLVALCISIPTSWYVMDSWLEDFAYRVDIKWWIFVGAGVGVITITLLTVSYQVIKAALMNPVTSLRSE
ncbi:MAG: ABC transporter permease [Imperialibacter sp.]|uniref:ABC transporter permease n=1 Tax=Imperialibacter sp. TaxID=2038411 RepID=UPI0032EF41BD